MKIRQWRRSVLAAVAITATLVSISACSSSATTTSSSGPITIGMSLPLTGPVADVALGGYQGYQQWAADVNASGGLLGRKIQLKVLDDGFSESAVVTNYTKLISQDKVDLLLGTFSSLLNGPASAVAARQNMVYVEPSGGNEALFTRGFKNLFFAQPATTATLPDQFVAYIKSLSTNERPKTAAYLAQDDPATGPAVDTFQKKLEALGVKTVYKDVYSPDTSSFDPIASAVVQGKPELIIHGAIADDGISFIRSLQKLNYSPKLFFQTGTPSGPGFAEGIGATNTEGIFTAVGWSAAASYPGNAEFVAAYTKKFGSAPTEDAANSYTAGQVLAAAVKAVGSIADQKALSSWLHSHTVDTIVGPLKWDKTGVPLGTLLLAQWQNDKLEILRPQPAATTKTVVFPKPAWQG
ncbi:amino acid ABC transporter substrate-binding protein [Lysinimonas soli]|uniref:Amino acid ABC transporter substrate-binding protein n=1 Tax=Lysinimonas soli TaxID=1074233 RepID=A0ABW0NNU5_9MICO